MDGSYLVPRIRVDRPAREPDPGSPVGPLVVRARTRGGQDAGGPRLEDDDRGLGRSQARVRIEVAAVRRVVVERRPDACPLLAERFAGTDRVGAILQLHGCVRVCLEVDPPRRIAIAPAVHREGHEVRAVGVIAEDRLALLARASPDRAQDHHPEAPVGRRRAQSAATAGQTMDRSVAEPEEADEPSRRQERLPSGGRLGHVVFPPRVHTA